MTRGYRRKKPQLYTLALDPDRTVDGGATSSSRPLTASKIVAPRKGVSGSSRRPFRLSPGPDRQSERPRRRGNIPDPSNGYRLGFFHLSLLRQGHPASPLCPLIPLVGTSTLAMCGLPQAPKTYTAAPRHAGSKLRQSQTHPNPQTSNTPRI